LKFYITLIKPVVKGSDTWAWGDRDDKLIGGKNESFQVLVLVHTITHTNRHRDS